jgi:hypothetical protein
MLRTTNYQHVLASQQSFCHRFLGPHAQLAAFFEAFLEFDPVLIVCALFVGLVNENRRLAWGSGSYRGSGCHGWDWFLCFLSFCLNRSGLLLGHRWRCLSHRSVGWRRLLHQVDLGGRGGSCLDCGRLLLLGWGWLWCWLDLHCRGNCCIDWGGSLLRLGWRRRGSLCFDRRELLPGLKPLGRWCWFLRRCWLWGSLLLPWQIGNEIGQAATAAKTEAHAVD